MSEEKTDGQRGVTRLSFMKSSAGVLARRGDRRGAGRGRERRRAQGRRGPPDRAHPARAGGRLRPRREAGRGHRRLRDVREDLPRPGARQAPAGRGSEAAQGRWQLMSSHREAPEISKDPVADNTDVYAFVSPDNPVDGHVHHELRAAPGPARRPELLRVRRRRRSTGSTSTTTATGSRRSATCSCSTRRSRTRTRSSTTPARSRRSTARTGTGASSTRSGASTVTTSRPTSRARR